jgi:hypothetical protein
MGLIPQLLFATLLTLLEQSQAPIRIINPTNPNPMPGDARMNQFDDPKGANWRVFSVDSFPGGGPVITQVEEVRQQNPPSTWGVYVGNQDLLPMNKLTLAAAVVDVNGNVKATQPLPTIRNLKPQQVVRKEVRIHVTIIAPTDRVVFFVRDVVSETGDWKADDTDVAALIKKAASRLPVP